MPELVCTSEFTAKPNKVEKLVDALAQLIPLSRKEAGCIRYEMHRSTNNPDVVFFIERFKNQEAFDSHLNTPYVKNFVANEMPLLVDNLELKFYHEITVG
jgi:quinol monooxygenase YgiN